MTPGNAIFSAPSHCDGSDTSKSLLLELDLSLMSYQWLKTLGDDASTTSGQFPSPEHLIQTFDGQVSSLRARHAGTQCQRLEIMFHALHLQVYSFVIDRKNTSDPLTLGTAAFIDVVLAKAQSSAIRLISAMLQADDLGAFWPVFAKHSTMSAACICVYMAATTTDHEARRMLLEACKNAVAIFTGWSMFSKDSFSRIGRHIATAVRRVESQGLLSLQAMNNVPHKTAISARMAANIPYRVIWDAKHGSSPGPSTEPQHSMPTREDTSAFPTPVAGVDAGSSLDAPQSFDLLFNDWNDIALFDSMNEADFTDIWLDWQSLRGPIPDLA